MFQIAIDNIKKWLFHMKSEMTATAIKFHSLPNDDVMMWRDVTV